MISCDTNILMHALNIQSPQQASASNFLREHADNHDFAICELVLLELYVLLRNPAVVTHPLSALDAVETCKGFRSNPAWRVIDYPGSLMETIWQRASRPGAARRSVFDARLALTLRHHGVDQFATGNVRHFADFGFDRVWDPLNDPPP
ncbi:MAG: PIN domain-containing protein [Treponema sp.]|nr:PIN domain-containing protein [Treponema sp.]